LFRPSDIQSSQGDPAKAAAVLGWRAKVRLPEVVERMVRAQTAGP
jgi:GDP-D-mannose dehydratase